MTSTVFQSGTVITSPWLNDVNTATYTGLPNEIAARTAADSAITGTLASSSGSSTVGYTQGGAGAVTTTVQNKLRESVSVKDFGAVGNGIANDAAAIQAAINSLSSTGGQVVIPSGTYNIGTTTINMVTNVSLMGQGAGSNGFAATAKSSVLVYSGTGSAIYFNNCASSNLSNLTINCSATTGASVRGIFHNSSWLSVIENVLIYGVTPAKGYGILMATGVNGSQHNDLKHIECADGKIAFIGTSGFDEVTTTTVHTCRGLQYVCTHAQITFINATAESFTDFGFYFSGTGDSHLIHCDIEGSGTYGIQIDPAGTQKVYLTNTIWAGFTGTLRVFGTPEAEMTYGASKFLTSNITTGENFPTLAWGNNSPSSYTNFYSLIPYCDNATGGAQTAHLQVYRRINGANVLSEEYANFYRIENFSSLVANTPFTLVTLSLASTGFGGRVKVQISGLQAGAGWFEVSRESVVINNAGTLVKTDGTALAIQSGGSTGTITFTISGTNLLIQANHGSATQNQLYITVEYDGRLSSFTKA
jgi:hypothetical protein